MVCRRWYSIIERDEFYDLYKRSTYYGRLGKLEPLKILKENDMFENESFWSGASDEVINWALSMVESSPNDVYYYAGFGAVYGGNLKLLQFLHKKDSIDAKEMYIEAASHGHLHILKWAQEENIKCEWWDRVWDCATSNGYVDILEWLYTTQGYLWDGNVKWGKLNAIQWFLEKGRKWDKRIVTENLKLEELQWAHSKNYDVGTDICYLAAKKNNLDMLQWARSEGFPWDSSVCKVAAEKGYLKILIWARENGCDWNEDTCNSAAKSGNVACLMWARINGCPWTSAILKNANEKKVWLYVLANSEENWKQLSEYLDLLNMCREDN